VRPAVRALLAVAALLAAAAASGAGREPVLSQVALPHNYYWRELYIPQLTTTPSSVAFMPSGDELVYAMSGSLWRQRAPAGDYDNFVPDLAHEVTHPFAAYDHQPDVAPDGRSVVFARYDGKGFELWRHEFEGGAEQALTANGGVNLEPRISPDGRQLVFVSTAGTGHFNLTIADLSPNLANERYLCAAREPDRPHISKHDQYTINGPGRRTVSMFRYVTNAEIPWHWKDLPLWPQTAHNLLDKHQLETSWAAPRSRTHGKRIFRTTTAAGTSSGDDDGDAGRYR
jgi:dipeptidyl aminopeptidase/acylaminoacyl peptidase